jgi:hypothetical protein
VERPGINMLVRVFPPDLESADGFASRVEDVRPAGGGQPARFLVVAPQYPGDLIDPEPDALWTLAWVSERGRWELPVRCADAVRPATGSGRPAGPRTLWLTPAGPPRRNQRRRFFRAPWCGRVELDLLVDPYPTLAGRTLDVAEGGLRCLLPTGPIEPGTRVLVRLGLDAGTSGPPSGRQALAGVVRRSRRPVRTARVAGWCTEVALAFDDPDRYGDELRRHVVRLQLRARRLAPPEPRRP